MLGREPDDEIIGKLVRVKSCEAREHGDPEGCVCPLIGKTVRVGRRYKTWYAGTPSYHLRWHLQRVRRSEVVLLKNQGPLRNAVRWMGRYLRNKLAA